MGTQPELPPLEVKWVASFLEIGLSEVFQCAVVNPPNALRRSLYHNN